MSDVPVVPAGGRWFLEGADPDTASVSLDEAKAKVLAGEAFIRELRLPPRDLEAEG